MDNPNNGNLNNDFADLNGMPTPTPQSDTPSTPVQDTPLNTQSAPAEGTASQDELLTSLTPKVPVDEAAQLNPALEALSTENPTSVMPQVEQESTISTDTSPDLNTPNVMTTVETELDVMASAPTLNENVNTPPPQVDAPSPDPMSDTSAPISSDALPEVDTMASMPQAEPESVVPAPTSVEPSPVMADALPEVDTMTSMPHSEPENVVAAPVEQPMPSTDPVMDSTLPSGMPSDLSQPISSVSESQTLGESVQESMDAEVNTLEEPKEEKGGGAIVIVLIVLIVALLLGIGYFAYKIFLS